MIGTEQQRCSRRGWLISCGRSAMAAVIALLAAVLGARGIRADCPQRSLACRDCELLAGCRRPQANTARHTNSR